MLAIRTRWAPAVLAGVVILPLAVLYAGAAPQDKDKLPKAVEDTIKARFPDFKIDKWTKETEDGKVVYDIEGKLNGRKFEADIAEDGTLINYEKEIDAKDLPKVVRDAIDKKYPKSTLKECMEETTVNGKTEKLSAYEVTLVTAEKKEFEVRLSPEGKFLEEPAVEKKDKK
jgi:hypothetical protein